MLVRAIKTFDYAGKRINSGEEFETENSEHARVLEIAKCVEKIQNRAMQPTETENEPRRNRYKRRDMRADE